MQALDRLFLFASSGVWDLDKHWEAYLSETVTTMTDQIRHKPPAMGHTRGLDPTNLLGFRRVLRQIKFLGGLVFLNLSYCPELQSGYGRRTRAHLLQLAEDHLFDATNVRSRACTIDEYVGSYYLGSMQAEIKTGSPIVVCPLTGETTLTTAFNWYEHCLTKMDPTALPSHQSDNIALGTSSWMDQKALQVRQPRRSYMMAECIGELECTR
jgi:hypothetical protein